MKSLLLSLSVITLCLTLKLKESIGFHLQGFTPSEDLFGNQYWTKNTSNGKQTIYAGKKGSFQQQHQAALDTIIDVTKNPQRKQQILQCKKGSNIQALQIGGADVGYIGNQSKHQKITLKRRPDDCFQTVTVTFTDEKSNGNNQIKIQISGEKYKSIFCTETYIFATGAKFHVENFILTDTHVFTWKHMTQIEYQNVKTWGIHIFRLCDTLLNWFPNVLKSLQLFAGNIGAKIPLIGSTVQNLIEKQNIDFIKKATGYQWKQRTPHFLDLASDEVKSGDFLAVTSFNGVDSIIQYGTGSHAGHSCLVLEVDGVKSVVESQDGSNCPKHGIQRNDWETWKKLAIKARYNVAVLPLSQQSRDKFNVTAAEAFFKQRQGLPYGYHNVLFGWIDTPKKNFPPVLDPNFVLAIFSMLEKIDAFPIDRILTQALNKRLGVQHKNLSQVTVIMAEKNMTFGDLLAIPERDGWKYHDGQSFVCSSFVAALYKAGGLLIDIEGTQMTPRDVYTLNIFGKNYKVPEKCAKNDPTLPYCQIMGPYLMQLPGYNTIQQYPHMCQRCPTEPPNYFRPDGC